MTLDELHSYKSKLLREMSAVFDREHERRKALSEALRQSSEQTLFRLADWAASDRAVSLFGANPDSIGLKQRVISEIQTNPAVPLNRAEIICFLSIEDFSVSVSDFIETQIMAPHAQRQVSVARCVKLMHPSFEIEQVCEKEDVLTDVLESLLIEAKLRLNMAFDDVWTFPRGFLEHQDFVSQHSEFLKTKDLRDSLRDIVSEIKATMKVLGIRTSGPVFVYKNGDWGIPLEMLPPCHLRISRWPSMENRISMMMSGPCGAQDKPVRGTMKHIWDSKISGRHSPVRLAIELMTSAAMNANIEICDDWEYVQTEHSFQFGRKMR
jgi:hypothetical protein